ncbi:MAG: hypothetical protein HC805_06330, partial [Alkalinema sp. RL_2_19]|nr:hypothetical protein [Alkalinema sp. RL_2_19]
MRRVCDPTESGRKLAATLTSSADVVGDFSQLLGSDIAGVVIAKSAQAGEIISPLSAGGGFTRTGVGTIVDVSPPDLGRDVRLLEAISTRAGVNVVACTGIWIDIPRWFASATVEEMLRFDAPLHLFTRIAMEDVEVFGHR